MLIPEICGGTGLRQPKGRCTDECAGCTDFCAIFQLAPQSLSLHPSGALWINSTRPRRLTFRPRAPECFLCTLVAGSSEKKGRPGTKPRADFKTRYSLNSSSNQTLSVAHYPVMSGKGLQRPRYPERIPKHGTGSTISGRCNPRGLAPSPKMLVGPVANHGYRFNSRYRNLYRFPPSSGPTDTLG